MSFQFIFEFAIDLSSFVEVAIVYDICVSQGPKRRIDEYQTLQPTKFDRISRIDNYDILIYPTDAKSKLYLTFTKSQNSIDKELRRIRPDSTFPRLFLLIIPFLLHDSYRKATPLPLSTDVPCKASRNVLRSQQTRHKHTHNDRSPSRPRLTDTHHFTTVRPSRSQPPTRTHAGATTRNQRSFRNLRRGS